MNLKQDTDDNIPAQISKGCQIFLIDDDMSDKAFNSLMDVCKRKQSISDIKLDIDKVSDKRFDLILEALKVSTTVIEIDISYKYLNTYGAIAIAEALKANKSITFLDISGNSSMKDEGICAIIEALKYNNTLTHVALGYNRLETKHFILIAEIIKTNKTLESIEFGSGCDEGDIAIAKALKENNILLDLNVDENDFSEDEFIAFANALKDNKSLKNISLESIDCMTNKSDISDISDKARAALDAQKNKDREINF